ncbi:MAG: M18 family aminopeptidase [Muribaculaceae bacterium]|nr:M18 family aminopeptidase [Muribaculaceae bacterium]
MITPQTVDSRVADLMQFLDSSVCNLWAVETARQRLLAAGFEELDMRDAWSLRPAGRYFTVKNGTALIAFVVGAEFAPEKGCHIIAAHSDSPGFRIKPAPEMLADGRILKLNTEVYGGPILYTWFDRPLSVAGRLILRTDDPLRPLSRLVRIDRPVLTIPHLAIHYNRSVNEGNPLSRQKDMLPILAQLDETVSHRDYVLRLVAREAGVAPEEILDCDLLLYDTTPACRVGVDGEFITSGRIDDLEMVHAGLTALIETASRPSAVTRVLAVFDNEETGSATKQGAGSPLLYNILRRINASQGGDDESFIRGVASSFMVSADNAHATHPNYPEKQDPTNHPTLGGGPVIKINANCKYMTDGDGAAVFRAVCDRAGVPCQYFVNHSDVAGGSTLGNILTGQLELRGVDMGAPQLAMHSVRETAAAVDVAYTIAAFSEFFSL